MNPKERYLSDKDRIEWHRKLVDDPAFQDALLAVLNHYVWTLPHGENPAKSWDNHSRVIGAREFVQYFMAFAEPQPVKPKKQTLTYE